MRFPRIRMVLYINVLNTMEPNAPRNYLTIYSVNGAKDSKSIIINIIKPLFEEIDKINNSEITIDFSGADNLQIELIESETKNLPKNVFAKDGVRGPVPLLCLHPKENVQGSFPCNSCSRKFEDTTVIKKKQKNLSNKIFNEHTHTHTKRLH